MNKIYINTLNELPEHCSDCPCHNKEFDYCQADKYTVDNKEYQRTSDWRPFWCPLNKA